MDLPGHGRSAPFPADRMYTLEAIAEAVSEQLEHTGPIDLVGHSLGGHIAIRIAAIRPVRRLVVFGTPPLPTAADAARGFLPAPALAKAFTATLSTDDARQLAEAYTWPGCPDVDAIAAGILNTDGRARAELGGQLASGVWSDEVALIRNSGADTYFVHGADDPFVSLPYLKDMAAQATLDGHVHVIEHAGHSPHLQQSQRFNTLVSELLARP